MALSFLRWPCIGLLVAVQALCLVWFLWVSYDIRMYPVKDYGYVIHEFDPWFNYRATEYLAKHGTSKFFKWYDYKSWYPLGRPVGTTIYPGMQLVGAGIFHVLKMVDIEISIPGPVSEAANHISLRSITAGYKWIPFLPNSIRLAPMTVNDICVLMPAWFGVLQSLFGGLLAYEATRSVNALVIAVGVMAVLPANLMRSVAGEFDNEAVAVTAILSTFWLWTRSVRSPSAWWFGIPAGLSYVFMVATWGGYIFVLNTIGLHALLLVGLGRFNSGVHKAYTLFFIIGTAGAMQIPVVGWTPLRSLEQMGPLGVFLGYQVLAFCDAQRRSRSMEPKEFVIFRIKCFAVLIVGLIGVAVVLTPMGYFGPLSSRIRALFVKHTKTGNPLVDSVAEHQPANSGMYQTHLSYPLEYVPLGCLVCLFNRTNGSYFLALYGFIAMHFSLKMSRLVLICGPITAIMCAIWAGFVIDFLTEPILVMFGKKYPSDWGPLVQIAASEGKDTAAKATPKGKAKQRKSKTESHATLKYRVKTEQDWGLEVWEEEFRPGGIAYIKRTVKMAIFNSIGDENVESLHGIRSVWRKNYLGRACLTVLLCFYLLFISPVGEEVGAFLDRCDLTAMHVASVAVMKKERGPGGKIVINDDPWQGYKWLAQNTPKDSRVFAWWDYGYQITGIGKRTSLADGNTWNHEHIATLGRLLSGGQKSSHSILRHLADYVLIMTGGVNDDLGISTHFARIGNSVFPDHCGDDDPYCMKYSYHGEPSPMMRRSLVYNLYQHGKGKKAGADPNLFELVWKSPRDLLRFFKVLNVSKASKDWVADPANRICDAPGSWYCTGQYPPAISKFLAKRNNFAQVEDFNKKGEKSAYTRMIEKEKYGRHSDL